MNPLNNITVANTTLNIYPGPIGISCSGGCDSSLLLYLLMKHSSDKLHIFTTGNNDRNRYNVIVANNIIEKCIQLTGNSNIEHHSSYCKTQTPENLWPKLQKYHIILNNEQNQQLYMLSFIFYVQDPKTLNIEMVEQSINK